MEIIRETTHALSNFNGSKERKNPLPDGDFKSMGLIHHLIREDGELKLYRLTIEGQELIKGFTLFAKGSFYRSYYTIDKAYEGYETKQQDNEQ